MLRDDVARPGAVAAELARAHGLAVSHVYRHALKGFAAQIPDAALAAIERNPRVAFIEPDQHVEAFDHLTDPTGIGRIGADHN